MVGLGQFWDQTNLEPIHRERFRRKYMSQVYAVAAVPDLYKNGLE